jgi:hypothetical protein
MKKLLTIALLTILILTGCNKPAEEPVDTTVEHNYYFTTGRYYLNADLQGQVLTSDGNIWDYTQDIISEEPSYHNEPVLVGFDDNGTPDDIYDDIIVGLVLDTNTAIYDALERKLSESFELERDGNNIRIQNIKEDI